MPRLHFLQQWFALSDEVVEDALHHIQVYRAFAGIDPGTTCIRDATTVLRFRHLLESHGLAAVLLATVDGVLEKRSLLQCRGTAVGNRSQWSVGNAQLVTGSATSGAAWDQATIPPRAR